MTAQLTVEITKQISPTVLFPFTLSNTPKKEKIAVTIMRIKKSLCFIKYNFINYKTYKKQILF